MITIKVTDREGQAHLVEGRAGESLMEAIRNAGMDELTAMCGGCCSCATCHVYIESGLELVGKASGDESDLLEMAEFLRDNSRLSCQIALELSLEGIEVRIAPEE